MKNNTVFCKTICRYICKPYKEHIDKTLQEVLNEHGCAFIHGGELFGSGNSKPLPKHLKHILDDYIEKRDKYTEMVNTIFNYIVSKSYYDYSELPIYYSYLELQKCLTPSLQKSVLGKKPIKPNDDIPKEVLQIYKQMELLEKL